MDFQNPETRKKIVQGGLTLVVAVAVIGAVVWIIVELNSHKDDSNNEAQPQGEVENEEALDSTAAAAPAAASLSRSSEQFFNSGMGYLRNKDNKQIEEEYRKHIITSTSSGMLRLNKNQIGEEIQRITEDREAEMLKQIANYDIAKFDPKKGRNGLLDERKIAKAGIQK